ncbi:hypothetical protein BDZ94DRAFT_1305721 [Collybia nuda]|uniref:Novel STAND NTPase 1 domain-containing protein n=1 Tax=Collybia nuda TaxID=64659 RepID=A0A9P5YDV8_9AGAR|nr:hypothetical protein BDZ94DRAFT_1305721 [Collybia nuda]
MVMASCLSCFGSNKRSEKKLKSEVPSPAEYALEGVKVSLDLLKYAAEFVPVPYVRPAVESALALIKVGEDMVSTLQRVDDLNKRVWALMLVMIKPFQGKALEDISPELQRDIELLTSDLQHIENVLRRIAAQNKLLTLIFKRLNEEKVEGCLDQLDESLSKFQVSREINDAVLLWEMATGIKAAYGVAEQSLKVTEEGLGVAKAGLDIAAGTFVIAKNTHELTQETMGIANKGLHVARDGLGVAKESLKVTTRVADQVDEIHTVLKQRLHDASPLPSREMPTKPRFFYGRDDVVEDVVDIFVGEKHCHVALLGAGGMGKTSVALAVMRHDSIIKKFGERRFWVPCVEGRSPTRFLDILVSCLRITQDTGDPLSDILYELKASTDPRVILLDNFETPWNLDGHQSEVERILCALADLPHIALIITMRSNFPPSDDIVWQCRPISFLDNIQARRVYNAIHPDVDSDPALDNLLAELGHMPLAITLMAQLGKKSGSTPSDLLQTWHEENIRTNMLDGGADAKRSINVSIALSVHSTPMQAKPDAFTLLATLSMFPAGTQYKNIARWVPTILDVPGTLAALTDTSLADQRARTVYVLPVIRSYMLHPLRFPDTVKAVVRDSICRFMSDHKSEPGDPTFTTDAQELANEETNIQAILLDVIKQGFHSNAVDALLIYCWYQHWTRPRLDVIESVLVVSRFSNETLHTAESLFCLGHMYSKLDYHKEAVKALVEAKDIFDSLGHKSKAAQCFMKLVDVYMFLQDDDGCCDAMEAAQRDLGEIGDEALAADALFRVGQYKWFIQERGDSREKLLEAQQIYFRLNKPMGVAHCNYWISRAYYGEKNLAEARRAAETAFVEYERLDHRDSAAETLIHLCRILEGIGCYDEAVRRALQGVHMYQDIGGPSGIAQGLEVLGKIYVKTGRYDEALSAYEQSIETFRPILGTFIARYGTALCLYGLEQAYRCQSRFEEADRINVLFKGMGIDVTGDRD